jgi:Holliday junction resolvasome RuvABC endonuclease subunit
MTLHRAACTTNSSQYFFNIKTIKTVINMNDTMLVALDLSLTSPGIAIVRDATSELQWALGCFAQRVREVKSMLGTNRVNNTVTLTVMSMIPASHCASDLERYKHIIDGICNMIDDSIRHRPAKSINVVIEGYAFMSGPAAGSSYKLHELGGIVKHTLCTNYVGVSINSLGPSQWRKLALGSGRADKRDIIEHVHRCAPFVDLLSVFGFPPSTSRVIPNPVQDVADAMGLALAHLRPVPPMKKKRKRKQCDSGVKHVTLTKHIMPSRSTSPPTVPM